MEFVVTIATLFFVVILQLIILANQQKTAKKIFELTKQFTKPGQSGRSRDRNSGGSRQHRKSQQDFRSKTSSNQQANVSGSVDNVEKSLRDINLKLKNAERDQEAARRKIKEKMGKDSSKRRHSRGNRDDTRGEKRRDRFNRNNRRNRNNKENTFESRNQSDEQSLKESTSSFLSENTDGHNQPVASLPDLNPTDFDSDTTQHGRKFTVKRRVLKDESESFPGQVVEENTSQSGESFASNTMSDNSDKQPEQTDTLESSNTSDISFGRR
jgi:hypothetical protein